MRLRPIARLIPIMVLVTACANETSTFTQVPAWDDPPSAAQGVLGYNRSSERLTVCGNCHVAQNATWAATAHAGAWAGLQNSGAAQAFCENCHTTGNLGNPATGATGFAAVQDARYHDVQCESCHGAGQNHVAAPDAGGNQPQASIKILADTTGTRLGGNLVRVTCAECHQGTHHPYVDEWERSEHNMGFVSGSDSCKPCHSAQGALDAWGESKAFVEIDGDPEPTVCAVCHDPHGSSNTAQLRFPLESNDIDENICMRCHQRNATPDTTSGSRQSPHSPEGPLLVGEAGWAPPGYTFPVDTSHGLRGNDRMCARCHVLASTVTNSVGAFVTNVSGHTFWAIPCVDANGQPTENNDCTDLDERDFNTCEDGCHAVGTARGAYTDAKAQTAAKVTQIEDLLTQVPPSELSSATGWTTAKGADFNAKLGAQEGSAIHNPILIRSLLDATIAAVETEYGLTRSGNTTEMRRGTAHPRWATRTSTRGR